MEFYIYLIGVSSIFYMVGHMFSAFWRNQKEYSNAEIFFIKNVLGISIILLVFSIIKTGGNSIFLGMLMLSVAYIFFERDRISFGGLNFLLKVEWNYIFIFNSIAILFLLLIKELLYSDLYNLHSDLLYYGSVADNLLINGVETTNLGYSVEVMSPNLYHYSNEWLVAFISWLSGKIGTLSLLYIYFPIVTSFLFFGIFILTKRITNYSTWISLLLSTVFFLLVRLANIKTGIFTDSFIFSNAQLKLSLVSIFLILSIITYRKNGYIFLSFLFLCISFIWPTTLPGIMGGVFLFMIHLRFKHQVKIWYLLVLFLIPLFYFGLFYTIQKPVLEVDLNEISTTKLDKLLYYIKNEFNLFTHLKYFFGSIVIRFYYYFPFLILIVINRNLFLNKLAKLKHFKDYGLLFFLIVTSALAARSALYFITDSAQVFENIFDHTFMPILMYLLIIALIKKDKKYSLISIVLVVFFINNAFNYLSNLPYKRDNQIHLALMNEFKDKDYKFATHVKKTGSRFDHINQAVYPPLTFLRAYSPTYFPTNMSILDRKLYQYDLEKDLSKKLRFSGYLKKSQLYMYVVNNGISEVDWNAKLAFLQEEKIDYFAVEKGSLDDQQLSMLNIAYEVKTFDDNVSLYKLTWD